MNRREFTTLLGGCLLFPQKLWSSVFSSQERSIPESTPKDRIFYTRTGSSAIYELVRPGILMGVLPGCSHFIRIYDKTGHLAGKHDNLIAAFEQAPADSLLVDDGFAQPYIGDLSQIDRNSTLLKEPTFALLHFADAENWVVEGMLKKCPVAIHTSILFMGRDWPTRYQEYKYKFELVKEYKIKAYELPPMKFFLSGESLSGH